MFSWCETSFFEMYWNEQSPARQATIRQLVVDKRLEFIGGGFVQNDEAVTHYNAIVDQVGGIS